MERAKGDGHYIISANYRGREITVLTNNSEAWDWLDDDNNMKKHQEAKRYCYNQVREKWEVLHEEELYRKWKLKHAYDSLAAHLTGF